MQESLVMICNSLLLPAWLPVISLSQCAVLRTEVRLAGQSDALQTLQGGAGGEGEAEEQQKWKQLRFGHLE